MCVLVLAQMKLQTDVAIFRGFYDMMPVEGVGVQYWFGGGRVWGWVWVWGWGWGWRRGSVCRLDAG